MKEPARRYARAADVAEDIRRWQEGEAITAHPPSMFYRLGKKIAKRRAVLTVGGVGILLVAAAAGLWLRAFREHARKDQELSFEKESRAGEARKLALARPFLEEARRTRSRIDRLLMTDDWSPDVVRALTDKVHTEVDRALEYYPDYPEALYEKARTFMVDRDRRRALEYYTKGIEHTTGYTTAYLSRARILLDHFEDERHACGSRAGISSPEMAALAAKIRSDLQQVDAWSKDTQELSFKSAALSLLEGEFEKAARIFEDTPEEPDQLPRMGVGGPLLASCPGDAREGDPRFHGVDQAPPAARLAVGIARNGASVGGDGRGAGPRHGGLPPRAGTGAGKRGGVPRVSARSSCSPETWTRRCRTSRWRWSGRRAFRSAGRPGMGPAPDARQRRRAGRRRGGSEAWVARSGRDDPPRPRQVFEGGYRGGQADFEEIVANIPDMRRRMRAWATPSANGEIPRAPLPSTTRRSRSTRCSPRPGTTGNAARDQGRMEQATADLGRAIALDPTDPFLYFDRGVIACNRGAWGRRRRTSAGASRCIRRDPTGSGSGSGSRERRPEKRRRRWRS